METRRGAMNTGPIRVRLAWLNWPSGARRALTLVYWLICNWVLFVPARTLPDVSLFEFQDKVGHLVLFVILAALVGWSIPATWLKGWRRFVVVLSVLAYGVCSECVQPLIPDADRAFEWWDMLVDGAGTLAGVWLCGRMALK